MAVKKGARTKKKKKTRALTWRKKEKKKVERAIRPAWNVNCQKPKLNLPGSTEGLT